MSAASKPALGRCGAAGAAGAGAAAGADGVCAAGVAATAGAGGAADPALSTSANVTEPSVPVPCKRSGSTPSSCARWRAAGLTLARTAVTATVDVAASPASRTCASTAPTFSSSPTGTRSSITPSRKISTSIAPLWVSTTATTSPRLTWLPGWTSHCTTLPVSMSAPNEGIRKSAMAIQWAWATPRAAATMSATRGSAASSMCAA